MRKAGRHRGRKIFCAVALAVLLMVLVPNVIEYGTQREHVRSVEDVTASGDTYDAIMVLGASVKPDGTPSDILRDRLDIATELYQAGVAPKIIMSGDNFSDVEYYDEVSAMKEYVVERGVPSEDVFCDHAGICTYDSMYRAQYVFGVDTMVTVTQTYHLYRALYDANHLGVSTIGVPSDLREYEWQANYNLREVVARVSDFAKVWTRANATYLSEPVSLDQSGDVTTW
jgi:SanA protein